MRFRMLETIKEYGAERLRESGEEIAFQRAHRDYFQAMAQQSDGEVRGPNQKFWLDRLETELDNLRAAMDFSAARADEDNGEAYLWIAGGLLGLWEMRGHWTEGRRRAEAALARGEGVPAARIPALSAAGMLSWRQNDLKAARLRFELALTLSRTSGNRRREMMNLVNLSGPVENQGDFAEAHRLLEQAYALSLELDDRLWQGFSLWGLASVASARGDLASTQTFYERVRVLQREVGDRQGEGAVLNNLAINARHKGDYAAAREYGRQALSIFQEFGYRLGEAQVQATLGDIEEAEGDFPAARAMYAAAVILAREVGQPGVEASALLGCASVARKGGDFAGARRDIGAALRLLRDSEAAPVIADALEVSAALFASESAAEDGAERAARLWGAAYAARERMGTPARADAPAQTAARAALGEVAFAAAWEAGKSLTLEEALAEALLSA